MKADPAEPEQARIPASVPRVRRVRVHPSALDLNRDVR